MWEDVAVSYKVYGSKHSISDNQPGHTIRGVRYNKPPPLGPNSNKPPLFSELGFWRYRFWGLPPSAAENFGILGSLYKGETRRRRKKILRFMLCTRGKIVQKFAKILADSEFQQPPPPWFHQIFFLRGVFFIELP